MSWLGKPSKKYDNFTLDKLFIRLFVCLFNENMSKAFNFYLSAVWVSLHSVSGLSQLSPRSVSDLKAFLTHFVVCLKLAIIDYGLVIEKKIRNSLSIFFKKMGSPRFLFWRLPLKSPSALDKSYNQTYGQTQIGNPWAPDRASKNVNGFYFLQW